MDDRNIVYALKEIVVNNGEAFCEVTLYRNLEKAKEECDKLIENKVKYLGAKIVDSDEGFIFLEDKDGNQYTIELVESYIIE